MVPTSRQTFVQFCLRKLGAPVIEINLSSDQIDDRVDEALSMFYDYHFDSSERVYYKYQIQTIDLTNRYITLPENIIGAISVFPIGQSLSSNNLFNIRYQIALNDLYDLTNTTLVPYYMAMQHIQFMELLLVGLQPIRFTRHANRLYIDMDWTRVNVGDYLIVEAQQVISPDDYAGVWSDRWLQRYATCLIKENWGDVLTKFKGINLPGAQQLNGEKIRDDARNERSVLERELIDNYSFPPSMIIG